MRQVTLITALALIVCASGFAQTKPASTRSSSLSKPEPDVRTFELTPVPPPTPALKHHLLFTYDERIPGNAALPYLQATLLLAPDSNEKAQRALDALDAKDEAGFTAAADSIDLPSMLDELDVAGRR